MSCDRSPLVTTSSIRFAFESCLSPSIQNPENRYAALNSYIETRAIANGPLWFGLACRFPQLMIVPSSFEYEPFILDIEAHQM